MKNKIANIVALLLLALNVHAQSYSIDWFKVSGGGGASSNGQYSVSGTIGQQDPGRSMTGGTFSLTAGFWSLYAVQTPGVPLLTISQNGLNGVIISWPSPSTGFILQQNSNLTSTNWVTSFSPTDNGTIKFIVVSPPTGNWYFRLKQ